MKGLSYFRGFLAKTIREVATLRAGLILFVASDKA